METNERIRKLVGAVVEFIYETIDAIDAGKPGLAGELAAVKAENAELKREVARLEKTAPAARTDPTPPPACGAKSPPEGARSPLPKYVERKGKKFGCNVQRKGLKLRKGGFETAQAAHDYAVGRIRELGAGAGAGVTDQMKGARSPLPKFVKQEGDKFSCEIRRNNLTVRKGGFATAQAAHDYAVEQIRESGGDPGGKQRRSASSKDLPRFVYKRKDKFEAVCNRKDIYFYKTGFKTAGAASEWAEAEFVRKSAGGETTAPAGSSHVSRPDPDRPQTTEEMKAAISESRERTVAKRKQWECIGCGHEFDGLDGLKPEICPECRCVIIAAMEVKG